MNPHSLSYESAFELKCPLLTAELSVVATAGSHYHESQDQPRDLGDIRQLLVSNQPVFRYEAWRFVS
jgi:hypothetical protein